MALATTNTNLLVIYYSIPTRGFPLGDVAVMAEGRIEAVERGRMRDLNALNQWALGADDDDQEMRSRLITNVHVRANLLAPLIVPQPLNCAPPD